MSTQRVCDLDGTVIYPESDEFFTVTDGRNGTTKDICVYCARSRKIVQRWAAGVEKVVGDRVFRAGPANQWESLVYDVTVAGTTGSDEPAWPMTAGVEVVDGTVTYVTRRAPRGSTSVSYELPGSSVPFDTYSIWGWMNEEWSDTPDGLPAGQS